MSISFDTVRRKILLNDLKEILGDDEYHILSILNLDNRLKVRVGNCEGEKIITEVAIAQDDCLSAAPFILYLAITLATKEEEPITIPTEHHHDHNFYMPSKNYITIDLKYADDITYLTTLKERNEKIEEDVPPILEKKASFCQQRRNRISDNYKKW